MSDLIKLLPDSLANQIAAGEVVQRPGSVVKELLENSVDAGASSINLIIKEAGKSLIQVIDDGCGMSDTDARMCFERHATSKIKTSKDLFQIHTLGFRGEAMASIAAVAHIELKTKIESNELGTKILIENSQVKSQEPTNCLTGTSISVKNLFFNVPARRNFLKSNQVELKHIHDEFVRVAIANPSVCFTFIQNEKKIYMLEKGKLSKRIVQLFGKTYQKQLLPCSETMSVLSISGYIGTPKQSKKTRGEQFFLINNRFVKNGYLHHAVANAYSGLIDDKANPFYVLNITISPDQIDINVHPTKTEIKFQDERLMYGVVNAAVKKSLASFNVTPPIDFSSEVSFDFLNKQREKHVSLSKQERAYGSFQTVSNNKERLDKVESLYRQAYQEDEIDIKEAQKEGNIKDMPTETLLLDHDIKKNINNATLHVHQKYLIQQVKSGLLVVDKTLALERILYEQIIKKTENKKKHSQSCLFPQKVVLNTSDLNLLLEIKKEINDLGFIFQQEDDKNILITGVPSHMGNCNEKNILENLIEQYKFNVKDLTLSKNENLARSLAKCTAHSKSSKLKEEEINYLIDQLFACSQPNFTSEGSPTYILVGLDLLNEWFK